MKILICDDHALVREGLRGVLAELGGPVELLEAAEGGEALRLAERHPDLDLLLLDLRMPGMDGWAGLRRFRTLHPTLPVVIVSASEDAADVTQDVFMHLLAHADDYDAGRGPLLPWLLGIARNFVHKRAGADARYVADEDEIEEIEAIEPAHDEAIDSRREIDRLRRAIAALPPHYRDVLVLVELAERSYAEAAAICGCELNTVRSRLFRARALVAQALRASPGNALIARG